MYGLMVSGSYPCIRSGKLTAAMREHHIYHGCIALKRPPQLTEAYVHLDINAFQSMPEMAARIAEHPADFIHVHNEPNWPVLAAKDGARGRPVIYDVHDVTAAREGEPEDAWEKAAYEAADAFVFVTREQHEYATEAGLDTSGRPVVYIPNYAHAGHFISDTPFHHLGGVVYAGGAHTRSGGKFWRDMSPIADALDGDFYVYSAAGKPVDYGIQCPPERHYRKLIYRLAQHDWGFVGTPLEHPGYLHAIPNKAFDCFSAGIPVIAMNVPLLKPILDRGLGIYCDSYSDVREAAQTLPGPYKEAVMQYRAEYTMQAVTRELVSLYEELAC